MGLPLMGHIAAWSSLLPAIVGWMYRKNHGRAMNRFALFCIVAALNVVVALVLARLGVHNLFLFGIYSLVSVVLLASVFWSATTNVRVQRILLGSLVLFFLTWVLLEFIGAPNSGLNAPLVMATSFWFVMMSVVMLNDLLKTSTRRLTEYPIFWVLTGTIVYYAGTFVVLGLGNELMKLGVSAFTLAWHVNWVLTIVANLIYTKGMMCKSQG
jgi:hypothetical protein